MSLYERIVLKGRSQAVSEAFPPPGNMNPRAMMAATGTKWHQARWLLKGRPTFKQPRPLPNLRGDPVRAT